MLRNRGGCYKWSMYGLASHRCLEATPNLACANNCVFCWRRNINPTTKTWRWKDDDPKDIVEGMLSAHRAAVQNVSGMDGVAPDRLKEAMNPCHCALSLVGEPILYPRINALVKLLHQKKISTFLVTNGQFPSCIPTLSEVTQLYLSIDAPTSTAMKTLDRPIFPDFWDRFQESVGHMANRLERTVFRLTLIEGFNMNAEDIIGYASIISRGKPDFIELKCVTPAFQGHPGKILRLNNVPSWESVKSFAKRLCEVEPSYKLCCVHRHSGCVLLAHSKFNREGKWFTWIDFEEFHKLVEKGTSKLIPENYGKETPDWAFPNTVSEGFDPEQQKFITSKRTKLPNAA